MREPSTRACSAWTNRAAAAPRGGDPFLPSKKGYPALVVSSLDELAHKLEAAGLAVRRDDELAPRRRFYGEDPFGNRPEFL